jgi:hypothetical protein
MNVYITLADLRQYLGLGSAQTQDDALLLRLVEAASRLIERHIGRRFYPARRVQRYTVTDPAILPLRDDLLALASLTNGDGTPIALEACHLHPSDGPVWTILALDRTRAAFVHTGDPVDAIALDGTWGYHPDWPHAWAGSGDGVVDDPLAEGATALTVTDADGAAGDGIAPRFAAGQLLRVGDEYLHVVAVDAATNVLTVARGANGTAAASHSQGTAIAIYRAPADVRQVCLRVAAWLYKQKDAGFVQATGGLRGQVAVPPALPDDVTQILAPYARVTVA